MPRTLGHDDFDGGLARGRVLCEPIDDEKEQQLACGTEHRVKAPTRAGKAPERPEEAFHRVGGRGEAGTLHARDELGPLRLHRGHPRGNPSFRGPFGAYRASRQSCCHCGPGAAARSSDSSRAPRRGVGRLREKVWLYACLASVAGITAVGESSADRSSPHFVMVSYVTRAWKSCCICCTIPSEGEVMAAPPGKSARGTAE